MGSSSHDIEAELRMHSFTVNCDTLSNEVKVAVVVPVKSVRSNWFCSNVSSKCLYFVGKWSE